MANELRKLIQRRFYTFLNSRSGVGICLAAFVVVLVSGFQFGEVALQWSMDQYDAAFSLYHDNIAGKSFQDRLCSPLPIDIVYTWVNGSDPKLVIELEKVKLELEAERNRTKERERIFKMEQELARKRNLVPTGNLTKGTFNLSQAENSSNRDLRITDRPTSAFVTLGESHRELKGKERLKSNVKKQKKQKKQTSNEKGKLRSLKAIVATESKETKAKTNMEETGKPTKAQLTKRPPAITKPDDNNKKNNRSKEIKKKETMKTTTKTLQEKSSKPTAGVPLKGNICKDRLCLPAYALLVHGFPKNISLRQIQSIDKTFASALSVDYVSSEGKHEEQVTYIQFAYEKAVKDVMKRPVEWNKKNMTSAVGYLTVDCESECCFKMKNLVLVRWSSPVNVTHLDLTRAMVARFSHRVVGVTLFANKSLGVVKFDNSSLVETVLKLPKGNFTVVNMSAELSPAFMAWDAVTPLKPDEEKDESDDVMATSRFQDNEELRYSLRSVEKFAPWVRNIYLVTNGQIPYWLNLDHPRITVVTHKELFLNDSHLPTFSSPAIETHIHRIPGLSKRFIYMNDDVFFGQEVLPDDFYTHSRGHKVYLAWQVPSCADGCPSNWIRDKYCDIACNNSACDWDGGDCDGKHGRTFQYHTWRGSSFSSSSDPSRYCNVGCADAWLGDRYCDTACNVPPCGYDAGDCGTTNFKRFTEIVLRMDGTNEAIHLPLGLRAVWVNLTDLVSDGTITSGDISKKDVLRTAVVAQRYKTFIAVFRPGHNLTAISVILNGLVNRTTIFVIGFNFTVDTYTAELEENVGTLFPETNKTTLNETVPVRIQNDSKAYNFWEADDFKPKVPEPVDVKEYALPLFRNESLLPSDIQASLRSLKKEFDDGDLTEKGFYRKKSAFLREFLERNASFSEMVFGTTFPQTLLETVSPNGNQSVFDSRRRSSEKDDKDKIAAKPDMKGQEKDKSKDEKNDETGKKVNVLKKRDNATVKGRKLLFFDDTVNNNAAMDDDVLVTDEDILLADWIANTKQKQLALNKDLERARLEWEENHEPQTRDQALGRGAFPWEKQGVFNQLVAESVQEEAYSTEGRGGRRRLLDTFAKSLNYVNRLYNKYYGYTGRKVPGHMPHMIDKDIMADLQTVFAREFEATSSRKLRTIKDMQFAFSYNYFVMSEQRKFNASREFQLLDTDESGILSYRELRTLMTRMYGVPLAKKSLDLFDQTILNCSRDANYTAPNVSAADIDFNYDDDLPLVTFDLFRQCQPITDLLNKTGDKHKYRFEILGEDDIAFRMICDNITKTVQKLDEVRKEMRKFICLNDNIDHRKPLTRMVTALLVDFYESFFPNPSQFELPPEYRNRFLHVEELNEWRRQQEDWRFWVHVVFVVLLLLVFSSFFISQMKQLRQKWRNFVTRLGKRRRGRSMTV